MLPARVRGGSEVVSGDDEPSGTLGRLAELLDVELRRGWRCRTYRDSFSRDAGLQAEFVVPRFAIDHDIEDVIGLAAQCQYLILAADADVWSRGAKDLRERLASLGARHARLDLMPGKHEFPEAARAAAYTASSGSSRRSSSSPCTAVTTS